MRNFSNGFFHVMRDWLSALRHSGLRLPISARLTLWYGCSILLLLGLFGAYLYVSFHVGLHRDLRATLEREKTHLLATAEHSGTREATGARLTHHHATGPETYVRVFAPDGRVQARSANFQGRGALPSVLPASATDETVARRWGAANARSLYTPLRSEAGAPGGWLEITRLESELHHEMHRLAWLLVLGGLAGTGMALAVGYGLARRALRPVSRLTEAARQIQREGLGQRLPIRQGAARDELTDLSAAFNDMLGRLEASFERERRFRADAAHQLMTPLSAMQSEAEVTLRKERAPAGYEESLRRIASRSQEMAGLVEGLLTLSRAEQQEPRLQTSGSEREGPVDLGRTVRAVFGKMAPAAEAAQVSLEQDLADGLTVAAGEEALGAIVENVLSNAIKYTPESGRIVARTRTEGEHAVLTVEDTGIGFDPDHGEKLFDRFHREPGRQTDASGSGLGLSIARALARRHGGRLTAHSEGEHRGSTFKLRLPRPE